MNFHSLLRNFINGGCLDRSDVLLSAIWPEIPFRKHASRICRAFAAQNVIEGNSSRTFEWPVYVGSNPELHRLKDELETLKDYIAFVLLHGSQADGQTTGYSDVDALVVLRDNAFRHPQQLAETAIRLNRMRSIFHRIDPLQHHGWFVMTEKDLKHYPHHILPVEVLDEACVLMGQTTVTVQYEPVGKRQYVTALQLALERMERLLSKHALPTNIFALKSLLSEFMMLPVLYLQAKEGKGCPKRVSFSQVATDFSPAVWSSMEKVSAVRREWKYTPGKLPGKVLKGASGFAWKLRKVYPLAVPASVRRAMREVNIQDMKELVNAMKSRATELSTRSAV